mgnify:CR=1 FL=1
MAHFEVGKKVIAVANHSQGNYKRGQVFPLNGIKKGCSHYTVLLDVGLVVHGNNAFSGCPICLSDFSKNIHYVDSRNFAPYDDSLSELTAEDILNEQTVTI